MESYKKLIGKKIQRRRVELEHSQESLAGKLDVEQPQISAWERGVNLPEGKHRAKLGEVLDVDDDFFEMIELSPTTREHLIGEIVAALSKLSDDGLETAKMNVEGLVEIYRKSSPKSGEKS